MSTSTFGSNCVIDFNVKFYLIVDVRIITQPLYKILCQIRPQCRVGMIHILNVDERVDFCIECVQEHYTAPLAPHENLWTFIVPIL